MEPIRPGKLWPDNNDVHNNAHGGGVLFHEGRYYWFGEHKITREAGNVAHAGVHVYSSLDLCNWTDEGIALPVTGDPASPITRGCILERPKVIFNGRTGRFVMWFHLEPKDAGYSGSLSGVAVADNAAGPYRFLRAFRPNAGVWPLNVPDSEKVELSHAELARVNALELPGASVPYYPKHLLFRRDFAGGQMARDMTLFVDDDGSAYHIYSSEANGALQISKLTEDYLQPAGKYVRVLSGRFNEAPAMMKWRGRYFLFISDCTSWAPNPARLLAADSILGAMGGTGQSVHWVGRPDRHYIRISIDLRAPGSGEARRVHFYGGSVAAAQCHRRAVHLATNSVSPRGADDCLAR